MIQINDICKEWGIAVSELKRLIDGGAFSNQEIKLKNETYFIDRDAVLRELGTVQIYRGEYRSRLVFAALRSDNKIIIYQRECIRPKTKELGEKIANNLLKYGVLSKINEEVLMAFYIFEGESVPNNIKQQISVGERGFAGQCVYRDRICCQTVRVCIDGGSTFSMKEYNKLIEMIVEDWNLRNAVKQNIEITANGINVGRIINKNRYYYPEFNTYPTKTDERVFLRFQQYIKSEECIFDIEVNGIIYRGSLLEIINEGKIKYELSEVQVEEYTDGNLFDIFVPELRGKEVLKGMYRSTRPLPSFDKVEDCKVVLQGIGEESEMEHIPLVEYRDIL